MKNLQNIFRTDPEKSCLQEYIHAYKQTGRQTDRQIERQTDRQTDKNKLKILKCFDQKITIIFVK